MGRSFMIISLGPDEETCQRHYHTADAFMVSPPVKLHAEDNGGDAPPTPDGAAAGNQCGRGPYAGPAP